MRLFSTRGVFQAMKGVLLVNLGTPEAPTPGAVGVYLREFLSDPRVVDLPRWFWLPLLRLVILPLRCRRSAEAYREIWLPEGSPLLIFSQKLADRLADELAHEAAVVLAMRYGNPSIPDGLKRLRERGVERVVILPLYPQYSATTTESVFDGVADALRSMEWYPQLDSVQHYYREAAWTEAIAGSIRDFQREAGRPDKLLFSLHGIPQRYVTAGDPYAEQCGESVAAVTRALGLGDGEWLLTFQSRVGREPWLQPYTDKTLEELGASGVNHVQVVCPGFAVDCLETLEEIAMQNRDLFLSAGGKKLEYIPALNDSPAHVNLLADLVRKNRHVEAAPDPGQSPR
jgi:ferrochelatase